MSEYLDQARPNCFRKKQTIVEKNSDSKNEEKTIQFVLKTDGELDVADSTSEEGEPEEQPESSYDSEQDEVNSLSDVREDTESISSIDEASSK